MTHPIGGRRPGGRASGDSHDVDKNTQRGGKVDAAAEQDPEIAAKQGGPVKLKDAGYARNLRDRIHQRRGGAGPAQQPPEAGDRGGNAVDAYRPDVLPVRHQER